jgi:cytidylate kinase
MTNSVPVIAIDGPSASGKGTIAERVAQKLEFRYLDSGAIYRVTALAAERADIAMDDESRLVEIAARLDLQFTEGKVLLNGSDVKENLRAETTGNNASKIASFPLLRTALLERQRAFRQMPGLVADGRDMGSVVFPDATIKIFLTASVDARAKRRYKQLKQKGIYANLDAILEDLRLRDARDSTRSAAPLKICDDAIVLDTTELSIDTVVSFVIDKYKSIARAKGR